MDTASSHLSRPISFLAYLTFTSTVCTYTYDRLSTSAICKQGHQCTCLSLCLSGDDKQRAWSSDYPQNSSALSIKQWLEYGGDQGRHGASGLTRPCSMLVPPRNPCADVLQSRWTCRLHSRAGGGLLWLREVVCSYIDPPPCNAISPLA